MTGNYWIDFVIDWSMLLFASWKLIHTSLSHGFDDSYIPVTLLLSFIPESFSSILFAYIETRFDIKWGLLLDPLPSSWNIAIKIYRK